MSNLTLVDIFAGIGGLSLGFEDAGFECIAGIEFNAEHRKILQAVHPAANVDYYDATDFDTKNLLKALDLRKGELTVLVGGPPCQPFSMAGKRRGEKDDRGKLIDHFIRAVDGLRPQAFVMENVVGLKSIHEGRLLRNIVKDLEALGYVIPPIGKLNAADYGVPQMRNRIFIVGLRTKGLPYEYPLPTHSIRPSHRLPIGGGIHSLESYVTVADAIDDLPCNGPHADDFLVEDDVGLPYVAPPTTAYQKEMRGRKRFVTGNRTSVHFDHIVDAIGALQPGEEEPKTRYRRLYPNRPAFTLRAGSGTFTALRPIHPYRDRVITIREAARLQSFPDRIDFNPIKKWAYQAIGNSVPPKLARAVAERLRDFIS